ncbi:MAG: hypothetical protein ABJO43_19200, partial [Marinobacter sp.]
DSSVMAVCKPVTIPGMTGHVRRNTHQNGLLTSDVLSKETIDGCRSIKMKSESAYMEQKAPSYEHLTDDDHQLVLQSLGISSADLIAGTRPTLVNTGNGFVVVGIRDAGVIQGLEPDFELIEKLSDALDLVGFYVFSFDGVENGRDA